MIATSDSLNNDITYRAYCMVLKRKVILQLLTEALTKDEKNG